MKKRVLVLGCTGSIGSSTLQIIRQYPDLFEVVGLSAHTNKEQLIILAKEFKTKFCLSSQNSDVFLRELIESSHADIVVNGISGAAGLPPSISALECGMDLALANKETIVMAGSLIKKLAQQNNCLILPVDSEHSAVFNLIRAFNTEKVKKIVLTASGGPFRTTEAEKIPFMTAREALKHPTWTMGQKITIDSASLANKGLEVIEACYLFDMQPEQVKVVIHPQSLIHSLIQTLDGVLYAQISKPDMKHPIFNALMYPDYVQNDFELLDLTQNIEMSFSAPRYADFPMLSLAYDSLKKGGAYSIVYNAANEVAVEAFLKGHILFGDIPSLTNHVLQADWSKKAETFDQVLDFDLKARNLARNFFKSNVERQRI